MRCAVILPAAGASTRFGPGPKKPFTALGGRPIWLRSAELFWNRADVAQVLLVISPNDREEFEDRFRPTMLFANARVVSGGAERFESVANALACLPDDAGYVAVHDAVRPLCTPTEIDAVFAAALQHGAAMLATPVVDTLKRVNPATQRIEATVPREHLWAAATPQVFRRDWLTAAYAQRHTLAEPITDDAQLIEAIGHRVVVVAGQRTNLKITTREDLIMAEAILKHREAAPDAPRRAFHPDDDAGW